VFRVTAAGVRLLVDRLDQHQSHQPPHAFAVHRPAIPAQHRHHAPRAVERRRQIQLVDPAHQPQIVLAHRGRAPIQRRARDLQQTALRHDRQIGARTVDQ